MIVYVEAFREDNTEILGNLDGQGRITVHRYYKRTYHYRNLKRENVHEEWVRWTRPAFWRIVTQQGQIIETIPNPLYKKNSS